MPVKATARPAVPSIWSATRSSAQQRHELTHPPATLPGWAIELDITSTLSKGPKTPEEQPGP